MPFIVNEKMAKRADQKRLGLSSMSPEPVSFNRCAQVSGVSTCPLFGNFRGTDNSRSRNKRFNYSLRSNERPGFSAMEGSGDASGTYGMIPPFSEYRNPGIGSRSKTFTCLKTTPQKYDEESEEMGLNSQRRSELSMRSRWRNSWFNETPNSRWRPDRTEEPLMASPSGWNQRVNCLSESFYDKTRLSNKFHYMPMSETYPRYSTPTLHTPWKRYSDEASKKPSLVDQTKQCGIIDGDEGSLGLTVPSSDLSHGAKLTRYGLYRSPSNNPTRVRLDKSLLFSVPGHFLRPVTWSKEYQDAKNTDEKDEQNTSYSRCPTQSHSHHSGPSPCYPIPLRRSLLFERYNPDTMALNKSICLDTYFEMKYKYLDTNENSDKGVESNSNKNISLQPSIFHKNDNNNMAFHHRMNDYFRSEFFRLHKISNILKENTQLRQIQSVIRSKTGLERQRSNSEGIT